MEQDCKVHRAQFIQKSIEIREHFSFASPDVVLKAVQVYCSDSYGSMLWNLRSESAESYFKCWNTCVKLVNRVPRNTFTYLVEGYLAKDQTSLRNQVLARYTSFFQSLLKSPSKEIALLANIVGRDPSSNTSDNIRYIRELTNLNPWSYSASRIKAELPSQAVPENEKWRLGLMTALIKMRNKRYGCHEDYKQVVGMLDSLCNS